MCHLRDLCTLEGLSIFGVCRLVGEGYWFRSAPPRGPARAEGLSGLGAKLVAEGLPTNQIICCKSDKNDVLTDHPIFSALAWGLRQIVASTFQSSISPGTVGRLLGLAQIFYIPEFLQNIYPGARERERERERTGPVSKKIKSLASQQGAKGQQQQFIHKLNLSRRSPDKEPS